MKCPTKESDTVAKNTKLIVLTLFFNSKHKTI